MQNRYRDIFNEQAGDSEIFKSSPNSVAMNKLAMAGDNISSVNTPYKTASARNAENKKKGDDVAASVSQQILLAQQQFNEAMESARASIIEFEDTLEGAQNELDAKKSELDEITITLADGRKAYLNTDSNQFIQQDKEGNWHDLDNMQQAEAHSLWQSSGVTATQQDKVMLDTQQDKINSNSNKMEESKAKLDDIQQSVDSEIMTTIKGKEAANRVADNVEDIKKEFSESITITPKNHVPESANNESGSLFAPTQNRSVLSDSSPLSEIDKISGIFSNAADNQPSEPNTPLPNNIPTPSHTADFSNSP